MRFSSDTFESGEHATAVAERSTGPHGGAGAAVGRLGAHARRFVLVSATILIASCSSIKLGYNNAEWLLQYSLDGYFDLDERQETLLRERTRNVLAWHRSTQLRDYAQVLESAAARIRQPLTADDILAFQNQINERMTAVGVFAAPDLADLAATLTPAQIDQLSTRLAKDTSKARRELVSFAGPESSDERVKRFIERAQTWFGELRRDQVELVRQAFAQRPADQEYWLAERERRQRELVQLLRRIESEKPAHDTAARWVREYVAQLANPTDASRRDRVTSYRRMNAELMAQLLNGASPEQRAHAQKKLRSYADEFATLANTKPPRSG